MNDAECVEFLQRALPRLSLRWSGFRKVRKQVCKRLSRRLRDLGLTDGAAYAAYLEAHPAEWARLDAMCRISISRFWRDRGVFEALAEHVLPDLAQSAERSGTAALRVWSAGCASGEEPYSLSILWSSRLASRFPAVALDIVASDADAGLLARAARAVYPRGCVRELPATLVAAAFEDCDGALRLRAAYRSPVRFLCQDIRQAMPDGPFDLILCRNLAFTYFDAGLQRELLAGLTDRLRPGGYLVVGAHEALPQPTAGFAQIEGALPIYQYTAVQPGLTSINGDGAAAR